MHDYRNERFAARRTFKKKTKNITFFKIAGESFLFLLVNIA